MAARKATEKEPESTPPATETTPPAGENPPVGVTHPATETPTEVPEEETGEYKVAVIITGTRNGDPWPGLGESVTLPVAEATQYLALGYVTKAE